MNRRLFAYHPKIGYTFIPDLKTRVPHEGGGYLVRTNECGFRCDHPVTKERPKGRYRALLFGDSFTAGDGVSNGNRYGDCLEREIPDLEVLNFGLPGTGTDQQFVAYEEFGAEVSADLLIVAILVENIRRVTARYRVFIDEAGEQRIYAKPYFEIVEGDLVLRGIPVAKTSIDPEQLPQKDSDHVDRGGRFQLLRQAVRGMGLQDISQRLTRYQPVPDYDSDRSLAWQLLALILSMWIARAKIPVLLVPLPLYQFVEETSDPSSYQRRFLELSGRTGCHLHDPLPDLLKYPKDERRGFRFPKDIHLTRAGHAAIAASLSPVVNRLLHTTSADA